LIPFAAGTPVKAPPMPSGFLVSTQALWRSFWKSALARAVELDTDLAAIQRLFTLYDERERAYRGFRKKRLIEGSLGQSALNPLGRAMATFDAEIRQLEDRLGLTPRARLQLGIVFGEAAKSLQELNRALEQDDEGDEIDPRN
jgi:P27 family predicted phage terminase small subunit